VITPDAMNVLRFGALFRSGVFNTCTGCHGTKSCCTLTPDQTVFDESIVEAAVPICTPGLPRAVPYNSPGSNLFQEITVPRCGGALLGDSVDGSLSAAEKDRIRRWIVTGALRWASPDRRGSAREARTPPTARAVRLASSHALRPGCSHFKTAG